MMFDAMCRAAEAIGGRFEKQLRMCSLLVSEQREALLTRDQGERLKTIRSIEQEFRLPWPYTVVDWGVKAVFMSRLGKSLEDPNADPIPSRITTDDSRRCGTGSIGIESRDVFMIAQTGRLGDDYRRTVTTVATVTMGSPMSSEHLRRMVMAPGDLLVYSERSGEVFNLADQWVRFGHLAQGLVDEVRAAWHGAYLRIAQSMKPGNWIVSGAPKSPVDEGAVKIPRSHQRRHYIVISDQERRRCFRESVEASPSEDRDVTPHARRAHYRHIGENDDGTKKYTWVRACWVGSTEAEIKGQKYRVELEL